MDLATLAVRVTETGADVTARKLEGLQKTGDKTAKTFEQDIPRGTRTMQGALQNASRNLESLRRPVALVSAGLAAAFGAGAILAVNRWRNAYAQLTTTIRNSRELGLAVDEFSRLEFAARASDVEVESLTGGIRNLSRFMTEAAKGGKEQAGILKQLGIEAKAADGSLRPTHDVLREMADVFMRVEDPTNRAALAMKVFGEQGTKLLPIFEDGADGLDRLAKKSDELGYTFRGEAASGAKEIKRAMDEFKLSVDGLWRQSLTQLLPKLGDLATLLNSRDFREGFNTIIQGAVTAVSALSKFATTTANVTRFIGEELSARVHGPSADDTVRVQDRIDRLQSTIEAFRKGGLNLLSASEMIPSDYFRTSGEVIQRLQSELDKEQNKLKVGIELQESVTAAAKRIADDAAKGLSPVAINWGELGGGGGGRQSGRSLPDFSKDAAEQLREAVAAVLEARGAFDAWAAQLSGPLADANYQFAIDMEKLNQLARDGEVSADRLANAQANLRREHEANVEAIREQLNPQLQVIRALEEEVTYMRANTLEQYRLAAARMAGKDATDEQVKSIADLLRTRDQLAEADYNWRQFSGNVSDSLFDIVSGADSAGDAIKRFFDNLNAQILRNITDDWAKSITDAFKGMGQGGDSGGGFWASMIGSLFGGARASGGGVDRRKAYLVGERGPELFLPMQNGAVFDAAMTRRLGRGILDQSTAGSRGGHVQPYEVSNTFVVQGSIDRRSAGQIASQAGREINNALRRR